MADTKLEEKPGTGEQVAKEVKKTLEVLTAPTRKAAEGVEKTLEEPGVKEVATVAGWIPGPHSMPLHAANAVSEASKTGKAIEDGLPVSATVHALKTVGHATGNVTCNIPGVNIAAKAARTALSIGGDKIIEVAGEAPEKPAISPDFADYELASAA